MIKLANEKLVILGFIVIFYIATHAAYNIEHEEATLQELRCEKDNPRKVVNYIIPGMLRVPKSAFQPFVNEMVGDVVFVDLNCTVWDSKLFAKQIVEDAKAKGYLDVRIFAISIGDKVARKIDSKIGHDLRKAGAVITTYDINPCANRAEAASGSRIGLVLGAPLFRLVTFLLGPLGYLDIIPGDRPSKSDPNRHSLVELSSQIWAIAFEDTGKFGRSSNLVLSKEDARLNNRQIREDAERANSIAVINSGHADIIGYRDNYLDALNDLGAFDDD
ncbi:hypothetical protein IJJ18_00200 [Candidatus Saccharibacteria bacterium]|nr:hypothetical protein [Candidatus Saccharibacteria bacterium]